jgi:hypothetical protein
MERHTVFFRIPKAHSSFDSQNALQVAEAFTTMNRRHRILNPCIWSLTMNKISSRLVAVSLTGLAALFATSAFAGPKCTSEPREKWLGEHQMNKKLVELGFKDDVKKLHVSSGNCWEIYGHDKDGNKIEVYFHPITGEIAKQETKR